MLIVVVVGSLAATDQTGRVARVAFEEALGSNLVGPTFEPCATFAEPVCIRQVPISGPSLCLRLRHCHTGEALGFRLAAQWRELHCGKSTFQCTRKIQHGRGSFPHGFREPEPESVRFGSCGSGSCGSDLRFRRFAIYLLRKRVFIGEASEYLYWFSSSDSVSHYSRYSGGQIVDAFRARKGRECQTVEESVPCWVVEQGATGNCGGNGGCKFFRISGAYGTETPNSGRIGSHGAEGSDNLWLRALGLGFTGCRALVRCRIVNLGSSGLLHQAAQNRLVPC